MQPQLLTALSPYQGGCEAVRSNQSLEPTAGRYDDRIRFYETVLDVCRARSRQRWLSSVSLGASAYPVNESKNIRLEVTDEFYLSPIVRTDKAAYLEHFADPEIAHNLLAIPFPYTEADADWWLDRCEQSIGSPMMNFALRTPSGYLIGAIGVVGALSADAHGAEFGYWLARSYRGARSYASRHPHIQRLRISRAPNSSAFCYAVLLESCIAPRTGEGRFSARRATQTSSPQARHLSRCYYLWTHF